MGAMRTAAGSSSDTPSLMAGAVLTCARRAGVTVKLATTKPASNA